MSKEVYSFRWLYDTLSDGKLKLNAVDYDDRGSVLDLRDQNIIGDTEEGIREIATRIIMAELHEKGITYVDLSSFAGRKTDE
jgi:hypothetical protein